MEHVTVHCIGAEVKDAMGSGHAWEEFFHWLPKLRHLEVAFIGHVQSKCPIQQSNIITGEWEKFSPRAL